MCLLVIQHFLFLIGFPLKLLELGSILLDGVVLLIDLLLQCSSDLEHVFFVLVDAFSRLVDIMVSNNSYHLVSYSILPKVDF